MTVKKQKVNSLFDSALSFEDALAQLEKNVECLEDGKLPLKDALSIFKESMGLSELCLKELNEAEQILTKITLDGNGIPKVESWDPTGGED